MEAEAKRKAFRITGQAESTFVDGSAEVLNRLSLGPIRGRRDSNVDRVVGDRDVARRGEDVGDKLLGFARSAHVRREQRCEIGFSIRTDDTDHVDDDLELAVMAHKSPGELAEQQVAGLTVLEIVVILAARALVAMYPGMYQVPPGRHELAEITARDLVDDCERLLESLDAHRRHATLHLPVDDSADDDDADGRSSHDHHEPGTMQAR